MTETVEQSARGGNRTDAFAGQDPLPGAEIKALKEAGKCGDEAPPVVRKVHKRGTAADPLRGRFATIIDGRSVVVEYEPDRDLRDTEQIPLTEKGGIEAFLRREVLPYAADASHRPDSVKVGRSRCGPWPRSALISWPWSRRLTACWRRFWATANRRDAMKTTPRGSDND